MTAWMWSRSAMASVSRRTPAHPLVSTVPLDSASNARQIPSGEKSFLRGTCIPGPGACQSCTPPANAMSHSPFGSVRSKMHRHQRRGAGRRTFTLGPLRFSRYETPLRGKLCRSPCGDPERPRDSIGSGMRNQVIQQVLVHSRTGVDPDRAAEPGWHVPPLRGPPHTPGIGDAEGP